MIRKVNEKKKVNTRMAFDFGFMNKEQIEAVKHKDGPCRVIAGAGSGKTKVLTERIH